MRFRNLTAFLSIQALLSTCSELSPVSRSLTHRLYSAWRHQLRCSPHPQSGRKNDEIPLTNAIFVPLRIIDNVLNRYLILWMLTWRAISGRNIDGDVPVIFHGSRTIWRVLQGRFWKAKGPSGFRLAARNACPYGKHAKSNKTVNERQVESRSSHAGCRPRNFFSGAICLFPEAPCYKDGAGSCWKGFSELPVS